MKSDNIRILFVDNQVDAREWLAEQLRQKYNFEVDTASDRTEALNQIRDTHGRYDVVLMDLRLGAGPDGIEAMKEIRADYPEVEVIIITGFGGVEDGIKAIKEGACNFVLKPLDCDHLAVYIYSAAERRRLKTDLHLTSQERDWLQGLLSVSQTATLNLDPQQAAREIYEQISRLIPSMKAFYIALYDESKDELGFMLKVDKEEGDQWSPRSLNDPKDWGLTGYIIKTRQPLFIDDLLLEQDQLPVKSFNFGEPARSYIGLPLISTDKIIGVLSAQSYEPNAFSEDHKKLLQAIANQAAATIENALLHEQKSRRVMVLSRLYETLTALRTSLDLDHILNLIVSHLRELFNLSTCTIGLLDQGKGKIEFVAEQGLNGKVSYFLKDLPDDLVKQVLVDQEFIEIPNLKDRLDLKKFLVRPDLNSFFIIPLKGKKDSLGIITMGSKERIIFSQEHKELLRALSDQAAIAIENAKLHEETQSWARMLEMLDQAALDIAGPLEAKELLRMVIRTATELLQGAGGGVYLFSDMGEELVLKAAYGLPVILEGARIGKDKGVVGRVIRTREPFAKSAYRTWPDRLEALDDYNITAVVGVPVIYGQQLLGVLAVHDVKEGREFTLAQQDLLQLFGRHAGAAIEKARLLEERRTIDEVIQDLASARNYTQLFDHIIELLNGRLGYPACALLLKDQRTSELYIKSAINYSQEVQQATRIKINNGKGVTGWVAKTGEPLIVPDVDKESRYVRGVSGGRSEIAVPLKAGGNVFGVIDVESTKLNAFNEHDKRVLTQIADAIASAIENAQHLENGESENGKQNFTDVAVKIAAALEDAQHFKELADFSRSVIAASSLEDSLEVVAAKMLTVFPVTFCIIMMLTRDGHTLRVRVASPKSGDTNLEWDPQVESLCPLLSIPSLSKIVHNSASKVFKRGQENDEKFLDDFAKHAFLNGTLESALMIPLREESRVLGICILGNMQEGEGETFDQKRIEFAVTLAAAAAVPIERARKLELEHEQLLALSRLHEAGNTIAATLKLDEVLDLIVRYGKELLNAEVCSMFLVRRNGYLSLVSNCGSPEGSFELGLELEIKEGERVGLTGHIAKKGELFNMHGKDLLSHPAIKGQGPYNHLPSGHCTSLLAIPLKRKVGDSYEVIGLIKAENKLDKTGKSDPAIGFDEREVLILNTLASYGLTAIQNAELFNAARTLEKVVEVNPVLDYDEMLHRVLVELSNLIPYSTASIQLLKGDVLEVVACEWFDEEEKKDVLKLKFPLIPKFPNEQVIRNKQPLLIHNVRSSEYEHFWREAKIYCSGHIRTWLGIPLLHDDEVIGMLSIESNSPSAYTKLHEERGLRFASQVVSVIANDRSMQSLLGFVEEITKQLEPEIVLKKIVNDTIDKNLIGADVAIIYLYNPDSDRFEENPVYAGDLRGDPNAINPPFGRTAILHRCTQLKRPYVKDDVLGDALLDGPFVKREGIRSAAVFPLLLDQELVGIMFVNFRTPHQFTPPEIGFMKLLARYAAIGIHNARQYQSVLHRMETASAMARVGRLASIWAHDVQSPTLAIRALVSDLRSRLTDKYDKDILSKIYDAAQKIATVIPSLPDRHDEEKVNLSAVLEEVRERRRADLSKAGINLETNLDQMPSVWGNQRWMVLVIDGLIKNALRFMPKGGTLILNGKVSNRRLILEVIDTGPGLPDNVRDQLYKGKVSDPRSDGRGWNLLLIKNVLNDFGGDIKLPFKDQRGNVFQLDLPLALD